LKENHKLKDENISLQDELQYHTSRSVEDEKSILSLKNMNLQLENMAQVFSLSFLSFFLFSRNQKKLISNKSKMFNEFKNLKKI